MVNAPTCRTAKEGPRTAVITPVPFSLRVTKIGQVKASESATVRHLGRHLRLIRQWKQPKGVKELEAKP